MWDKIMFEKFGAWLVALFFNNLMRPGQAASPELAFKFPKKIQIFTLM